MTTPRSDAQRLASQTNGARSHGPATPEGRLASSRNATKHGLSGEGKSLPPDMQAELDTEIAIYSAKHLPHDDYEYHLIRRAALASVRFQRICDTLNAQADDRYRNAPRDWDHNRADEISRLAAQLPLDPASSTQLLRRTAEGCDFLGDSWESLAQSLQTTGSWTPSQSLQALHLLGLSSPPDLSNPQSPRARFWLCALALLIHHHHDLSEFPHNHPLRPTNSTPGSPNSAPGSPNSAPGSPSEPLPDPSEALTTLLEFIRAEVADLESEGNHLWDLYDLPSRESAPTRAAHDASPQTVLLNRYLAAAERTRRQALEELYRLRRDIVRIPPPIHNPTPPTPRSPLSTRLSVPNGPEPQTLHLGCVQASTTHHSGPQTWQFPNKPGPRTPSPLSSLDNLLTPAPKDHVFIPVSIIHSS